MFEFIILFFGKSIFATSLQLLIQGILCYSISKFSKAKVLIWEMVCRRLSLFLFLEAFCQFFYSLNSSYIGWNVPFGIRIAFVVAASVPLFNLWIDMPGLLIQHKSNAVLTQNLPIKEDKKIASLESNSEVTNRLIQSLRRLDKNCVISI